METIEKMDWLAFTVEMTKAVLWPLVVIVGIVVFRRALPGLLDRITTLRYGRFELAFEEQAVRVAESVSAQTHPALSDASETADEALLNLARQSPRAAIIEAWARIETKLRSLHNDTDERSRTSPIPSIIRSLRTANVITAESENSLLGLMQLRNLAAHAAERELTPQKAIDFVVLAGAVLWVLGRHA